MCLARGASIRQPVVNLALNVWPVMGGGQGGGWPLRGLFDVARAAVLGTTLRR